VTARPSAAVDERPFDAGLQPERTALAWRRTALSLAVAGLIGARLLPHYWGAAGLLIAAVGIAASVALVLLAHRRYRMHHRVGLPGGALPALLVATTLGAAVVALMLIVTSR
jgi:putative membrane protein